jgi:L-aminopeptidase/D-esterase-like protein
MNATATITERCRVRALGLACGILPTGPLNAITDVSGVQIGHVTLIEGEEIRTGATAILPHAGNLYSLCMATTMSGYRGHTMPALPLDAVQMLQQSTAVDQR